MFSLHHICRMTYKYFFYIWINTINLVKYHISIIYFNFWHYLFNLFYYIYTFIYISKYFIILFNIIINISFKYFLYIFFFINYPFIIHFYHIIHKYHYKNILKNKKNYHLSPENRYFVFFLWNLEFRGNF